MGVGVVLGSRLRQLSVWVFRELGCGAITREVNFLGERLGTERCWGKIRLVTKFFWGGRSGVGLRSRSSNRAVMDSQMPPLVLSLSNDMKMFRK